MTTKRRQPDTQSIPTCPIGQSVPAEVLGARFDRVTRTYHWL